jgi:hypothetical protein
MFAFAFVTAILGTRSWSLHLRRWGLAGEDLALISAPGP